MSSKISEQLANILEGPIARLLSVLSKDAELRTVLRRLAQAVLDATEAAQAQDLHASPDQMEAARGSEPVAKDPALDSHTAALSELIEPVPSADHSVAALTPEDLAGLKLTALMLPAQEPQAEPASSPRTEFTEADVSLLQSRFKLKAEAARWAAERRRRIREKKEFSAEIHSRDREIIARGKEIPGCFLWMSHPTAPEPADLNLYEEVGGCFQAVAEGLSLVQKILSDSDRRQDELQQAMELLAEAQSVLRTSVYDLRGRPDTDQVQLYAWLKSTALSHDVFLERPIRADPPAQSSRWADLQAQIQAVEEKFRERLKRASQRRKLLGKVNHKAALILEEPPGRPEHWKILIDTVEQLVSEGLPSSNRELREMLLPVLDMAPEEIELPKNVQLVFREVEPFRTNNRPALAPSTIADNPSAEVKKAAQLLNQRSILVIGGERRPGGYEALKKAFNPRELIWIENRDHQSVSSFEPYVARHDVAVVLLAVRWSRHAYGEVKEYCERHGKPLVRLPGGYNPNQVAAQILRQCSTRLQPQGSEIGG